MTDERLNKIKSVVSQRQQGIIVLEDVHDPHNAMAVVRTAEAFGFQQVYFIFGQEKPFNPKKIGQSSSSSANKWLDFQIFKSTSACYSQLHRRGYQIFATILDSQAQSLYQTRFTSAKIALVFGNEHRGLSNPAVNLADQKIYIPMCGFIQSLNLSVTAAIFMAEITRRRQNFKKYLLSQRQQVQLLTSFSRR
jgi:tRNA (guanosine-2'-O-)-methyltransferase